MDEFETVIVRTERTGTGILCSSSNSYVQFPRFPNFPCERLQVWTKLEALLVRILILRRLSSQAKLAKFGAGGSKAGEAEVSRIQRAEWRGRRRGSIGGTKM